MTYAPIWDYVIGELFEGVWFPENWPVDCAWLIVDYEREWLGKGEDEPLTDADVDRLVGKLQGFLSWAEANHGLRNIKVPARFQVILKDWYEAGCAWPGVKDKGYRVKPH